LLFLVAVFIAGAARDVAAQSTDKRKPITLKPPSGYMPADFPEERVGKLLLNAKRPGGMFIVYPKAGEGPEVLPDLLKTMVVGMFFHDDKAQVSWTTTTLPAHKGIDNESGTLYAASNEQMEIQLAVYDRTLGGTRILYGYYGMRHKGKKEKDDAPFMDASGNGVDDFDKFWRSIHE
jgi:hypothetical protein